MPKENINCIAMNALRAEVSWRPDNGDGTGYVQLATVHTDSPATIPAEKTVTVAASNDATGEALAQVGATVAPAPPVTVVERLDGWHITLDREGCNRAIRALRKARDAAFGADA